MLGVNGTEIDEEDVGLLSSSSFGPGCSSLANAEILDIANNARMSPVNSNALNFLMKYPLK